jgi:Fur family peroxide stress response transcriptional regulator
MLEILRRTDVHPTADWVYKKLKDEIPNLSLGTVYRNIRVLMDQGLIQRLPFGSTFDRFEARVSPHYHLVCEQCGSVEDFMMPIYADINEKASKMSYFKIRRHRIDFFGLCTKCQNKKPMATMENKRSRKNRKKPR